MRVRSSQKTLTRDLSHVKSTVLENPKAHFDFFYKLIIIGDENTGKTNLLTRMTKNKFDLKSRQTYGVEYEFKNYKVPKSNQRVMA